MVYYIDEIMGRGKTSAMINHINRAPAGTKFLFITPLLDETDRIRSGCADKRFVSPEPFGSKLEHIKELFRQGRNIASTHALFSRFDQEAIEIIQQAGYTLILDETPAVVQTIYISTWDAKTILEKYAVMDELGRIQWVDEEYTGRYDVYRNMLDTKEVFAKSPYHWVTIMPEELFLSFRNVYIMTYMFRDQFTRAYLDLKHIPYRRKYINGNTPETYTISDRYEPAKVQNFKPLIHIVQNNRMNAIGDNIYALSKNWYKKHRTPESLKPLRNGLYNFYRNITGTSPRFNLWTTFCADDEFDEADGTSWRDLLKDRRFATGFLACNAKGTNAYREKTALAYLINTFPNTNIFNYFAYNGIKLNRDKYALSEMLQWIWRSAIRDGKEITIYIPSSRMRKLLEDWLDQCEKGGLGL